MAGTVARKLPSLGFEIAVSRTPGLDAMGVAYQEGMLGHLGDSHDRWLVQVLVDETAALAAVGED